MNDGTGDFSMYLFKLELEMMGINTYKNEDLVLKLYKLYLKEDKSDYRKRLEDALKYLADTDEENAKANAQVKYLDRFLKKESFPYHR